QCSALCLVVTSFPTRRSSDLHLSSIITPDRRLTARQVCERLTGMRLLALATVTADGRPLVGPVDGIFYRGAFYFGSSPDSVRFRSEEHTSELQSPCNLVCRLL